MKRRAILAGGSAAIGGVALGGLGLTSPQRAFARPIRVGQYTEVPFGVDSAHPSRCTGLDAQRSCHARFAVPTSAPEVAFRVDARGRYSPLVSSTGVVYATTDTGVVAFREGGRVLFSSEMRRITSTPSFAPGGELVIVRGGHELVRLSRDGVVSPQAAGRHLFSNGRANLILPDGTVVVPHRRGVVFVDELGRVAAEVDGLPCHSVGGAALFRGRIYAALGNELVVMTATGEVEGRIEVGATMERSIIVGPAFAADGTLWVATDDGVVRAFDPSGAARARVELGDTPLNYSNFGTMSQGGVALLTREGALRCFDREGAPTAAVSGNFTGGVMVGSGDVVLVSDSRGNLRAFDPSGNERWSVALGARSICPAVITPSAIYVQTVRTLVALSDPQTSSRAT